MAENETAASAATETAGEAGGEAAEAAPQAETAQAETAQAEAPQAEAAPEQPEAPPEEITYHAVEKDGQVTALWEMQGRKHLRTIDPRSRQGQEILRLYTSEHGE
ncbi:MAG: hypothetical protein QOJ70_937 [Acidobacteriota bacterium]|jgi:hypothetical protein|nr:hypothetical protein [Acidobacteriota bacterium]